MAQTSFQKSGTPGGGTVIGPGLTVEGEVAGDDAVSVEGTIKGRVATTSSVTVASGGVVEADVEAGTLSVSGALTGNVAAAERVELTSDARLIGDVRAPRISIAEGASFKGHIDMDVGG